MVIPPFDQVKLPLLGPALLTAACRERGMKVRTVYGNVMLAARAGYENYKAVSRFYLDSVIGERLFRDQAWPPEIAATLPPLPELGDRATAVFSAMQPHVAPFMDEFVERVLELRPRIVAIACTFEQIMAGSAIAWRVKQAAPETLVVMGGANIAAPMGAAFAKVFPWVDHFFSGEADVEFPEFCANFLALRKRPAERVIECAPIKNIGQSPLPDFSDYLAALEAEKASGRLPMTLPEGLPLESSRGCWWGMKNHCTFCGLNGSSMDFRTKSPEQFLQEVRDLVERYDPPYVSFTDNIMPLSYFETVLPELARWEKKPAFFYEVKANLKFAQLDLLRRAGVTQIQPGIESLSTKVLKLMRKGVSGIQNLLLLRDATSLNIYVLWNILYGFPGEEAADYEPFIALFPKIEHMRPPAFVVPVVIDRFSPHHEDPAAHGIDGYDPYPGFAALFPAGSPVDDLAYHFIGQHRTAFMADGAAVERLEKAFEAWQTRWQSGARPPILTTLDYGRDTTVIVDTRSMARQRMTPLTVAETAALAFFDMPRRANQLTPKAEQSLPKLFDHGFVVEHEGFYISVVTRPQAGDDVASPKGWFPVAV